MPNKSTPPKCHSVLVIEDNIDMQQLLKESLEDEGYEILTASNGKEGLDILAKNPSTCLILLDLMMPVMNGWQFLEAIGKNKTLASIPVIIVTAFSEEAKDIKARDFIEKPVDIEKLLHVMKKWCVLPRSSI